MMGHPRFVTFEGMDKTGKSTQIPLLSDYLRHNGFETVCTVEPGGTDLGRSIRELVLTKSEYELDPRTESLLFIADRAHHVRQVIRPALEAGKVVLCDRYVDSTLAYQGYGRGVDRSWLRQLHSETTDGLMPGLTILFDLPSGMSLGARDSKDRMEGGTEDFRARVREGFLQLAEQEPARIRTVRAELSIPEVQARIQELAEGLLVGPISRDGR